MVDGGALVQERRDTFRAVLGAGDLEDAFHFCLAVIGQAVLVLIKADGLLGVAKPEGGVGGHAPSPFAGLIQQLGRFHHLVDEADLLGLVGEDEASGEDHLVGHGLADQRGQRTRCAPLAHEAGGHRDLGEAHLVGTDAQVARDCHLDADAHRNAVDGGDGHLGQVLELAAHALGDDVEVVIGEPHQHLAILAAEAVLVAEAVVLVLLGDGLDLQIAPTAEVAAGTGDDDDAHRRIADLVHHLVQFHGQARPDGVGMLGSVEGQYPDGVVARVAGRRFDLPVQVAVFHWIIPFLS